MKRSSLIIKKSGRGASGPVRASSRDLKKVPRVALLVETSIASGRDKLAGIARYNREHGGWSLYHQPRGLELVSFETIRHWQGDGIIARIPSQEWLDVLCAKGVPVIDVLGIFPRSNLPRVLPDDAMIARLAAEHFIERGLRHFGFIGTKHEQWSDRRQEAFQAGVREQGGSFSAFITPRYERHRSWDAKMQSLAEWLADLPKPAGVFICSDQLGPETLEACRRAEIRVPDDIALLGVDNDEALCNISQPSLSSICPNHERVGYEAARLLDAWLKGEVPPPETLLPPRAVVVRQSTDILSIADEALVRAIHFIREHFARSITVDDVARATALSRSVLQRRFRSALGISVLDEILKTRLKHAQSLLEETKLSLVDIAERSGFRHQQYLGYVFKKRLQDTPGAYRARMGKGKGK